ncbi:partner and localizer of BRCA2 isoform X1 [Python bivittatus]|uniref:Partner and localizer of BRCA2 isoform X1 n=1 Tax=Python bivittatus TaxID=176946 RepID=A0A9F2WGY1_PYTBI|nr:partner and localizer of BRCA2 isoform X1 [Python bivittatus]
MSDRVSQLKEKLALLKREYNKTFHRLQRAERAVKVKNYIKKTVAEQNLLLAQEETAKNHAGGLSQLSPGPLEEGLAEICSESSTAEATPVLLTPEASEGGLPEMSGSRSSHQAGRRVLFVEPPPGRNCGLRSTSRTTGQRRGMLSLAKRGESVWEAHQRDTGGQLEHEMAVAQGSGSPIFKRRSNISETGQRSPPESSLPTSKGGSSNVNSLMLHPDCEQGMLVQTDVPGVTQPLPWVLSNASQVSLLDYLSEENISGLDDSAAMNIALCTNVQNEEKESVQMEEGHRWMGKRDPGRLADLAVTNDAVQGDKTLPDLHRNDIDNGRPPTKKTSGKDKGPNLEIGSPPLEGVTPNKGMLSSCTVVEGLMFPVEYYVRTTRRLSRCQKEVNLEAVIQSHLGRGRKGRRVMHRGQAVNPALSSPELPQCGDRLSLPPGAPGDASAQSPCLSPKSAGSGRGHVRCRKGQRLRRRTERTTSLSICQALLENPEGALPGAFVDPVEEFHRGKENCLHGSKAAVLTPAAAGSPLGSKQSSREGLEGPAPLASISQGAELQKVQRALPSSGRSQEGSGELHLSARKPSGQTGDPRHISPRLVQQDGRGHPPVGSQSPASPGFLRVDSAVAALPFLTQDREGSRLGWLPPSLASQEFHLPDEEFGHLKSKKLKVCPKKPLGIWDAGGSSEGPPRTAGEASLEEGAVSGQNLVSGMKGTPLVRSPRELLLSPALEGGQSLLQFPMPTPDFPCLGATPASPALQRREPSPGAFRVSPFQAAVAASSFPESGTRLPRSPGQVGIGGEAGEEAASLQEKQLPAEKPAERDKEPARQNNTAEDVLGMAPGGIQRESSLKMTSKLKNGSGSCLVDVSAVWWEAADFADLCIVTAEETSVSLWRPLDLGQWGTVHTWRFTKFPVIQIVPLPGALSLVCVVLGHLETAEIRFLFHSSEDGCIKEQVVKAGNINAVLGLADRKLVSSCWSLQGQEVEVFSFSEVGRSNKRRALKPPEETVLAFADVAGVQEALLGMTTMNCIVLWNLGTGQLLKKMPVGWSFPASVCHKAYSDSGLLFMVLSHPHAKESTLCGNPAFQIVALNPRTARSSGVMLLSLPPGVQGRYLERDVRNASAAAVLTSGTIAVWDLFLGQCTAVLPPNSEGSWSLARWSVTDTCLLTGQEDGTVYLYRYTGSMHSDQETCSIRNRPDFLPLKNSGAESL